MKIKKGDNVLNSRLYIYTLANQGSDYFCVFLYNFKICKHKYYENTQK